MTETFIPETNLGADETLQLEAVGEQEFYNEENLIRKKNRAIDVVAYTGMPLDDIETNELAAIDEAKRQIGNPVESSMARQEDLNGVENAYIKSLDLGQFDDFVIEGALASDNPNYSPALANILVNQQIASEAVQQRFEETLEQGGAKIAWDFIDYYIFRYLPFGLLEDLGMKQKWGGLEEAREQASLSPSDYKRTLPEQIESAAEEGVFTSENYFAVRRELERAINAGYAPEAAWDRAFGV